MEFSIWAPVLTIIGANLAIVFTAIGVTVALYMHGDKKIDAMRAEVVDFHKKLIEAQQGGKNNETT